MDPFFFNDIWRMDWGFGNPNKTAALIAMLMVAVWIFAYVRKSFFWTSLTLFTFLGICLIHTGSRGGIIAAVAGLLPLMFHAKRPWPRNRIIAVGLSVWAIASFSIFLQMLPRYTQGIVTKDPSITNRLEIWKRVPQMIADAPGGWGIGNSGKAYGDWYQPLEQSTEYRTLVSSHFTWLVEMGWLGRIAYLCAWGLVLVLCWPPKNARWLSIPFGIWFSFAVAAVFSSVAESLWIWPLPVLCFMATLGHRIWTREWPSLGLLSAPVCASVIAALTLVFFQNASFPIRASDHGNVVVIGTGEPEIWIVPDSEVLGKKYARTYRQYLHSVGSSHGSVAFAKSIDIIPIPNIKKICLSGSTGIKEWMTSHSTHREVVLLNPAEKPEAKKGEFVTVIFGEFSQSPSQYDWPQFASTFTKIQGAGDYLPNWPEILFSL